MKKFKFSKLVRDKIISHVEGLGGSVNFRELDRKSFIEALRKKLCEESEKLLNCSDNEILSELADVYKVLIQIADERSIPFSMIKKEMKRKDKEKGGFNERLFVNFVELPDESDMTKYLERNPDRYPEI